MTTQLDLWNLASSLLGITQRIETTASEQLHAIQCAVFEQAALEIVLAEWPWSFATAQSPLVLDCQEVTLLEFVLVEDEDEGQYVTLRTDRNVGLDDGDTVIINGVCGGVSYVDSEFPVVYVGELAEPEDPPPPPP